MWLITLPRVRAVCVGGRARSGWPSYPGGQAGVISRLALAHRGKPLVVMSGTHPILDDGEEWEAPPEA